VGNGQSLRVPWLLNFSFSIPKNKAEHTKIANFLTALDNKIALIEKQLSGTKQYKKGLLQQLFV
jgi:type I restriction enzyme S subunit